MLGYYVVTVILSFIYLFIVVYRDNEKKTGYYIKLLILIGCVANLGYLALGLSNELETAILANKIAYVGGCFLPPTLAFCICNICNIELKRYQKWLFLLFSMAVYTMVLTTGYSGFYYRSVQLGKVGNTTALYVDYGKGHIFLYVMLFGYIFIDFMITIIASIKKQVKKKNLFLLIALQVINVTTFVTVRAIYPMFEIMPAIYVIDGFFMVVIQIQISRYNLKDTIYASLEQNNKSGYIIFDSHKRFIGCNDVARECLPKLAECRVDTFIKNDEELHFLDEWIEKFKDSKEKTFIETVEYNDNYYQCDIKKVNIDRNNTGFIVEMQDCTDRRKYLDSMANYNAELEQQVEEQINKIKMIQLKTILGMASMVENRDNNTGGHIVRTSDVVKIFVDTIRTNQLLDVNETFCNDLIKAAPMHDIGKIAIRDNILQKPGRFTAEEFEIMKTHAEKSAEMVEKILRGVEEEHFVNVAVNVARYHHEKWNGLGYPNGLSEKEIPLEARIMAIADVYDALVSKRCYKEPMSFSEAYDIIIESMGSHFDPDMEQVFIMSRSRLETYYMNTGD